MHLNEDGIYKANQVRSFLLKTNDSERLKELECPICKGTGLEGVYKHESGASWASGEFCATCQGIGYLSTIKLGVEYLICNNCNGTGKDYGVIDDKCWKCNGAGIVSWLGILFGEKNDRNISR